MKTDCSYLPECSILVLHSSASCIISVPEIYAVIQGCLHIDNSGDIINTDSVFALFPGQYLFSCDCECTLLRIRINPVFILDRIPELIDWPAQPHILDSRCGLFTFLVSYARQALTAGCSLPRAESLHFFLLDHLEFLHEHARQSLLQKLSVRTCRTGQYPKLLDKLIIYVAQNMMQPLRLSDTAANFSVTSQYISSLFRNLCDTTFQKFLHNLRMQKACAYMQFTPLSRKDAAVRTMLDFHELPESSYYISQTEPIGIQIQKDVSVLERSWEKFPANTDSSDTCIHRSIHAGVSAERNEFPVWKQLINLGYALNLDRLETLYQLVKLQKTVGFRYGRLCRIFDLASSYRTESHIFYDFNRIFSILDVMVAHHMHPLIELGNKRFMIQFSTLDTLTPDIPEDTEEYFNYLLNILPHFITAAINRYGPDEMNTWLFEICYPQYAFMDTAVNFPILKYIDYFLKIRECIHRYLPQCQIGGPGFNNWDSEQIFKQFLLVCQSHNAIPDFLTAYLYPIKKEGSMLLLSTDPDLPENRIRQLQKTISMCCPKTELWITEFNSNLSSRNYLNDSSYQAAFIAHALFAAARNNVSAMGYYILSDMPLRYADTLDMLFGGWGLFTDTNIPKPSFHTWDLFSRLGTDIISCGGNYIITRTSEYHWQCLLYHFEPLNNDFQKKNVRKTDLFEPEKLFIHQTGECWNIFLPDIPAGAYMISSYTVSATQSNILYQWARLGFMNPVETAQYNILKMLSALLPDICCQTVQEGKPLELSCTLKGQSVCLITADYLEKI